MSWVKIGKHKDPNSSISAANSEMIVVRGFDLCKDLIGSVSFTEHFWLLVTGQRATPSQARVLDACLVAIAEHGLVPSVQAARMTYAAGPEAMQGAVAAGILGCGSVILGSAENAGEFLAKIYETSATATCAAAARALAQEYRAAQNSVPRLRPSAAHRRGPARRAADRGRRRRSASPGRMSPPRMPPKRAIREIMGRPLVLNVSGAIPAVLLDAAFRSAASRACRSWRARRASLRIWSRSRVRPIGFLLSEAAEGSIALRRHGAANFKPEAH